MQAANVTGDFAKGGDLKIIDPVLVGAELNIDYIKLLTCKVGEIIDCKIRHLLLTSEQMNDYFKDKRVLLMWEANTCSLKPACRQTGSKFFPFHHSRIIAFTHYSIYTFTFIP